MPDQKTARLITKWQAKRNELKQAEDAFNEAVIDSKRATSDLGAWLVPDDAHLGEIFNVWVNGELLMIRVQIGKNNYDISYRSEQNQPGEEQ